MWQIGLILGTEYSTLLPPQAPNIHLHLRFPCIHDPPLLLLAVNTRALLQNSNQYRQGLVTKIPRTAHPVQVVGELEGYFLQVVAVEVLGTGFWLWLWLLEVQLRVLGICNWRQEVSVLRSLQQVSPEQRVLVALWVPSPSPSPPI